MNIKKISLKNNGFNGAIVEYLLPETKGKFVLNTPVKKSPKDPIQKDLENLFKDLRIHLLNICQMSKNEDESEMKFILFETNVTGLEFDSDGFVLHGEREVFGNKAIKLNTPKVEEIDNYVGYEDVVAIAKDIISETKLYLDGEKKVSDQELAQRWLEAGKDKVMTKEMFDDLPLDEQRDWATSLLENKFGSIIIHSTEIAEDNSIQVEEEQVFELGEEILIPEAKEKKSKKSKPEVVKEEIPVITDEDEAF
jgi:hypothetical protein